MITEDYCSYEVAKLLKEKGFKCGATYSKGFVKDGDGFVGGLIRHEDKITHQMAMKWLREAHRKYIDIRYNNQNEEYRFIVFTMVKDKPIDFIHSEYHSTYEEAVEAALNYCLTKLI